jgi:hypothetical protein
MKSDTSTATVSAATSIPVPAPTLSVTEPEAPPPVKPDPAVTPVISPVFVVNPASLLNIDKPISLAAFLLSAPASRTINSFQPL